MSTQRFQIAGVVEPEPLEIIEKQEKVVANNIEEMRLAFLQAVELEELQTLAKDLAKRDVGRYMDVITKLFPQEKKITGRLDISHLLGEAGPPQERLQIENTEEYRLLPPLEGNKEEQAVEAVFEEFFGDADDSDN